MSNIQMTRDYGEPNFDESNEELLGWAVRIYNDTGLTVAGIGTIKGPGWMWHAQRNLDGLKWTLGETAAYDTYEAAKNECIAKLESLPPEGWIATEYARADDLTDTVYRSIGGVWKALRDGVASAGVWEYETAHLAAEGHEHEKWSE